MTSTKSIRVPLSSMNVDTCQVYDVSTPCPCMRGDMKARLVQVFELKYPFAACAACGNIAFIDIDMERDKFFPQETR